MRKIHLFLAAVLIAGLAFSAQAADLETALAGGKIFSTLRAAVAHSNLTMDEPLIFHTEHFGDVWVQKVTGLTSGNVDYIRVTPDASPGRPGAEEIAQRYAYNVVGGSKRCTIYLYDNTYYSGLIQVTDLDWNNLSQITGVSDRAGSIKTGCNGVWFFDDNNFNNSQTSDYMYIPANTNVPALGSMNNQITSFKHDLP